MNYKILFLRLLANVNLKRVIGMLCGLFVLGVGASSGSALLAAVGFIVLAIESWDLYEGKN